MHLNKQNKTNKKHSIFRHLRRKKNDYKYQYYSFFLSVKNEFIAVTYSLWSATLKIVFVP